MAEPADDSTEAALQTGGPSTTGDRPDVTLGDAPTEAVPRAVPTRVDRYVIERQLGAGGMGEVYAAWDPELDRRVAIKLVRAATSDHPLARARLLREAKALAKLDHPHIVPVHDAGDWQGHVWLAMELIDGRTLRRWLEARRPSHASILEVFVRAGRGLAAAHEAGILHRDFKPDNVMVAREHGSVPEIVRVTDFGLAATMEDEQVATEVVVVDGDDGGSGSLTQSGAVLGTVGYIAPEIYAKKPADPRTDQFSFCVALWEALYGRRPFVGNNAFAVATATLERRITTAQPRTPVPAHVRAALERGLARDPAERFDDMPALCAALRPPRRRPRRWAIATGITGVLGVTGAVALFGERQDPCVPPSWDGVWDDARAEAIGTAFTATAKPYADDALAHVRARLDAYGEEWSLRFREACEATHVAGTHGSQELELAVACLDARREDVRALVDVLAEADAEVVRGAATAVGALRPLVDCVDAGALRARASAPPDPESAAAVAQVQLELSRLRAQSRAGRYAQAIEIGTAALAQANSAGHRATTAEVLLELGGARLRTGALDQAQRDLRAALLEAEAARADEVAARAATTLAGLLGNQQGDWVRGEEWAEHARALIERLGGAPDIEANRVSNLGVIRRGQGRGDEARALFESALSSYRERGGDDSLDVADELSNLAVVELDAGQLDRAELRLADSLAIYARVLGVHHPAYAEALINLGTVKTQRLDHAGAADLYRRAIEVLEAAVGPDHATVAQARSNLAFSLMLMGRLDEARDMARRAVAIAVRSMGESHPETARLRRVLGEIALADGDPATAREALQPALAALAAAKDPTVDDARLELARAHFDAGAQGDARALIDLAIASATARGDSKSGLVGRAEMLCDPTKDAAFLALLRAR